MGIRIDSSENLTSFPPAICIKKIRKTKSVQCFAGFLIKVVGGFFPSINADEYMQLCKQNHPKKSTAHYFSGLVWPRRATHLPRRKSTKTERKIQTKPPGTVFFCGVVYLIQSGYIGRRLAAQKQFCCLKGRGP
jgi:hypothetical protein